MRRKVKWMAVVGLAVQLSGVSVLAFSEVSLLIQAVSGKVDVRLEEFTLEDGKEVPWKENRMVLPGTTLSKIARIFNEGEDCYIRASVEFKSERESEYPLSRENLTGISQDWVWRGEHCYYKKILTKEGTVDFFRGIQIPSQWKEKTDDNNHWEVNVKVDAIQAAFFHPEFSTEDPWKIKEKEYEIQKALEEDPVDQEGDEEQVILEIGENMKGFSVDTQEFFRNMETFVPGKVQKGRVVFENRTVRAREVYMKSEILEENEFLKELQLTIRKNVEGRQEVLYQGTFLADKLGEYQSIGKIPGNETGILEFELLLPEKADNRYSVKEGKVKFWFTTDVPEGEKRTAVQTGDQTPWWAILGVVLPIPVMAAGVVALGRKRRKR